jgi:Bacterial Ig-like domain
VEVRVLFGASSSIGAQNRSALVESDGTWNVTPTALSDATRTLSASVTDPAGNEGTDDQQLTVDTAAPTVAISGGANAITTDSTPTISGTTDVEAPGVVSVTINGETLTATPTAGAWSVTAAILANATYPVVASVSDGAGNPGSAGQQLTVDTVLPVVSIDGGPSLTTNDPTPTIIGTSDVAVGTVVRVRSALRIDPRRGGGRHVERDSGARRRGHVVRRRVGHRSRRQRGQRRSAADRRHDRTRRDADSDAHSPHSHSDSDSDRLRHPRRRRRRAPPPP